MNFAQFAAEEGFNRLTHAEDALADESLTEALEAHIAYNKAHPVSSEWKQDAQALGRGDFDPHMTARKAFQQVTNAAATRRVYDSISFGREQMERRAKNALQHAYRLPDMKALRKDLLGW